MNTEPLSTPGLSEDGEELLRYAASLLARNDTELAVILHRPNLWGVTVGTLIDAGKSPRKSFKRHLRPVPSTGDTKALSTPCSRRANCRSFG